MRIDFTVTTESGSEPLCIELPSADEEILRKFLTEYERLSASSPLQKDIPCGLNFNFTPEKGLVLTPNIPSTDDLAILLHRLRPFLLQQEPYSFQKTAAALGRHLSHAAFRSLLAYMYRLWRCEGGNAQMPIMLNSREINTEEVLLQWLNATEYHRDPEKGAAIERLRNQVPGELFDFVIVNLTLEKLRAVIACAKLASVMVGHLRDLSFETYRFVRMSPN
jgi:hypothetical protein